MVTQSRDLHTGRSYWLSRPMPRVPFTTLRRDIKTDVLIVGAGVTGALLAEALSSDHRVTIVDRRGPARGSTAASTALVEYEIDTPLSLLAGQIGRTNAVRAWRRSFLALHALGARTRELGIRADLRAADNLYLAGNVLDPRQLEEEAAMRRHFGLETRFLSRAELKARFGIARSAALLAYGDLALDPRRLTAGYLNAALSRGARLLAPVDVSDVETAADGVTAATTGGPTIGCKALIFATGYEMPRVIPQRRHRVISTYAIATKPQPRNLWPEDCFIWEASDAYLYVRSTPDGRVICGGEDEDFSDEDARDALIPQKAAAIARKLKRLLPRVDTTPEFAWAGAFGSTATGLPSIGAVPRMPNCYAALGFGGNGITYSRIAADVIAGAIAGRRDPDADLFDFRKPRAKP
jgi:glycine/D-amino acid oxidase-like deaminating enzyme